MITKPCGMSRTQEWILLLQCGTQLLSYIVESSALQKDGRKNMIVCGPLLAFDTQSNPITVHNIDIYGSWLGKPSFDANSSSSLGT